MGEGLVRDRGETHSSGSNRLRREILWGLGDGLYSCLSERAKYSPPFGEFLRRNFMVEALLATRLHG